jgi:peroxiredoxin (alkyl hydroperoxide reductase subunit C)
LVVQLILNSHTLHGEKLQLKMVELEELNIPLVADITKQISKDFDVLFGDSVALRGSFLIDKDGTVRHAVINDLPLGRNIDEMIRMVDTMLFTNEHGEVCPAGWSKGDEGMKADKSGVAEYLAKHSSDL